MSRSLPDSIRLAALARVEAGEQMTVVSADMGIGLKTLQTWKAQAQRPVSTGSGVKTPAPYAVGYRYPGGKGRFSE